MDEMDYMGVRIMEAVGVLVDRSIFEQVHFQVEVYLVQTVGMVERWAVVEAGVEELR